jgi:hypothetical protein
VSGPRTPSPVPDRPAWLDWLWLALCVVLSSLWCLTAGRQLGATYDEPIYVHRGLEAWRTGSYWSLMREGTMPLPLDLQTLPLYIAERVRSTPFDPSVELHRLLPWARAMTLAFWWLLLGYAWRAARALGGRWAGWLAVGLLAADPTLLAHASLATTDVAIAACLLAFLYHFRQGREAGWVRRIGLPALWFGAAVLAKVSGLILGLFCVTLIELHRLGWPAFRSGPRAAWAALGPLRRDGVAIVGLGLVVVFLYCGSDWEQEPSFVAWTRTLPPGPARAVMTWTADHLVIFRNAGDAIVRQFKHNVRGRSPLLLGHIHPHGVWYYFPVVLAIKLTVGWLALLAFLLAWRPRALTNWACATAGTLFLLSLTFRVQLGVRFLLPLYGLAAVGLAAATVTAFRDPGPPWGRRAAVAVAAGAVAWTVIASARVWPDGIGYVNELWGGTAEGYHLVGDSNYDWGHGLPELARWQREHGVTALDVWYFGTDPLLDRMPAQRIGFAEKGVADVDDLVELVRGRYLAANTWLLYAGAARTPSEQWVAEYLRARPPVGSTRTFRIYDFTRE